MQGFNFKESIRKGWTFVVIGPLRERRICLDKICHELATRTANKSLSVQPIFVGQGEWLEKIEKMRHKLPHQINILEFGKNSRNVNFNQNNWFTTVFNARHFENIVVMLLGEESDIIPALRCAVDVVFLVGISSWKNNHKLIHNICQKWIVTEPYSKVSDIISKTQKSDCIVVNHDRNFYTKLYKWKLP